MTRSYWENPGRTNPELEATRERWNDRYCRAIAPQPVETSRGWPWWLLTSIQLAVCAAPVAVIIALIRIAEAMQ
jgi:hypothetical protein